jgi:hypothetical protein
MRVLARKRRHQVTNIARQLALQPLKTNNKTMEAISLLTFGAGAAAFVTQYADTLFRPKGETNASSLYLAVVPRAFVPPHSPRLSTNSSAEHANACEPAHSVIAGLPYQISRRRALLPVAQWPRCSERRRRSGLDSAGAQPAAGQRSLSFQTAPRRALPPTAVALLTVSATNNGTTARRLLSNKRECAAVLAPVQGKAASRRPSGRPGPTLRATPAQSLVGTEEWCSAGPNKRNR